METKVFKAMLLGFLGFVVNIIFLCILSIVFPKRFGGWIDGIPFYLLPLLPKLLIGSLFGIVVGVIFGIRIDNIGKGGFVGSIVGGVIGILIPIKSDVNLFFWLRVPYYLVYVLGVALSLYFYHKNPKKYLLTTISFSLFFLVNLLGQIFVITVNTQQIFTIVSNIMAIAAWIVLLIAIFIQPINSIEKTNQI